MKKILVVLVMLLALTSCGGGADLSSVLSRISKNQTTDARLFKKALDSITAVFNGGDFKDALTQFKTTTDALDYDAVHLGIINNDYASFTKKEEAKVLVDKGIQILLAVNKAKRAWLIDVQKSMTDENADTLREAVTRNDAKIESLPAQVAQAHAYFSQAKTIEGLPAELTEFQ